MEQLTAASVSRAERSRARSNAAGSLALKDGAMLTADDPRVRLPFRPQARHSTPAGMAIPGSGPNQQLYPESVWQDPLEERSRSGCPAQPTTTAPSPRAPGAGQAAACGLRPGR